MIVQEYLDNQTSSQFTFEEYIDEIVDEKVPEIEIDSVKDVDFGELYRVWNGSQLIGTFYQNLEGKWVGQACDRDERLYCDTPDAVQILIVAVNGLLVADAA